ncbi:MAG: calcium/sodium antiporter [Candidatus Lokiarchaeota archaeon]|nr:calcium/sodium antiporter [Candidatus Lokiarchaeota archaeon]
MLIFIFWIILGFIGLYFGAKFVIIGLENIANKLKISHLMVGLTVLAIGTSLPEVAVSVMGGIDKLLGVAPNIDGIVIGNKVGSFMIQITLILGILGLSQNIFISKWELRREFIMLFLSIFIFIIFALDLVITYFEAFLLITSYVLYIIFVIWSEKKIERKDLRFITSEKERFTPKSVKTVDSAIETRSIKYYIGFFLIGLIILIIAADITVLASSIFARELDIPANVIGILIVGLGTSLPELVADLTAIRRKSYGIAVGDILGSNICDILAATGAGAIIIEFNVPLIILVFDIPMLLIALCFVTYFFWTEKTLKKWESAFLVGYFGFYALLKIYYFQSTMFYIT